MGYPSTVDTGLVTPLVLTSDAVLTGGSSAALTANTVYVLKYALTVPVLITAMRWKATATAAGNVNLGIYDSTGAILGSTGSVANTAATTNANANLTANLSLSPGNYYLAFTVGNNSDTFTRSNNLGSAGSPLIAAYTAANNSTGTTSPVLPLTLGNLTISTVLPAFGAVVSGGV